MTPSLIGQISDDAVHERRRSVRHAAVNQIAKLRLPSGREELCRLQDISAEGMRAQVYIALAAGAEIHVELRTAHGIRGRVVWARDGEIGVAFDEPIPAAAMLAHCSFEETGGPVRPPRIKVDLRGLLRIGGATTMVDIGNLSQAGLQVAAPDQLESGAACTIALPRLPARAATVCWWRDGAAGLMLTDPFDYETFAAWRAGAA